MTRQMTNYTFEVDGIPYVHPDYRDTREARMDAYFNARYMIEIMDDNDLLDPVNEYKAFRWSGPPMTRGLMDD